MSSSSTAAAAAAASASTPTSSGGKHPHWEDEAWTVDSDDEDFVCRQQQQHFVSSSSIASRKHRHPHPPLPRQSSTSSSSSFTSTSAGARPGPPPHLNSRTSWLLVDSVPSSSSTPIPTTSGAAAASRTAISSLQSSNTADLDAAIAGSPPTDLGPSAEAAVYNASFLGASPGLPPTPGTTNSASSATTIESNLTTVSPLTRVPSSRTKRRWTEFVKALGGVTPPTPAQATAATVSASSSSSSSSSTNGTAPPTTPTDSDVTATANQFSTSLSISSPSTTASAPTAVNLDELRKAAWKGVPDELRPMVWQLLLGYLPPQPSARSSTLARKRSDYAAAVDQAFGKGKFGLDQSIWHQIEIDVPRTNPGIPLWQREATQRSLERVLYVWALRHPASGYVQGIADLATPFYEVFLGSYIDSDPEQYDVAHLPVQTLQALEADTFWCLSKLLDGIQDNYIFAQPGIQRQVKLMGELVARIDAPLHQHLAEQNVQYMQFAFRWMNCLLMREMSVRNIVRMWDTYLAEGPDSFADFHPFVCAGLLRKWSSRLMEMDFQGIIMFLQNLPTKDWSNSDAEDLLAQAFMYKSLFGNTAHLR